jgi:tetratricopeptide (TPR) repeat protein
MKNSRKVNMYRALSYLIFAIAGFQLLPGCSTPDWFVGLGGAYNEGRYEFYRRVGGDMDKAVDRFEYIARQDPTYRDSLTLLGRAYYRKGRYQDAHQILQRALALNAKDELAWLTYGITQLRLNDDARGVESIRGGLTLLGKAMAEDGYRGYKVWDVGGRVKNALRRAVFVALKGAEQKDELIRSVEAVLLAIDEEEFYQLIEKGVIRRSVEG